MLHSKGLLWHTRAPTAEWFDEKNLDNENSMAELNMTIDQSVVIFFLKNKIASSGEIWRSE
jgi:hypothetical protein